MPRFTVLDIPGKGQSQICLCGPGMIEYFLAAVGDAHVIIFDDMVVGIFYQQYGSQYIEHLASFVSLKLSFGYLVVFTSPSFREHNVLSDRKTWSVEEVVVAPYFSSVKGFRERAFGVVRFEELSFVEVAASGNDLIRRFDLSQLRTPCYEWVSRNSTSMKVDIDGDRMVISNPVSERFRIVDRINFKTSG